MEATTKFKRKTLIVNRKLQYRIVAYMTCIAAMASLITTLTAAILANHATAVGPIGTTLLMSSVYFAAIAGWAMVLVLFSNRVFGPIYRLHREIKNWRDGQPVNFIQLRKGDHLTDLIEDFNELAAKEAPKQSPAVSSN